MKTTSPVRYGFFERCRQTLLTRQKAPGSSRRAPAVAEPLESRIAPAVVITATLTGSPTSVNPGGNIHYTEVVSNTGSTDATVLQIAHVLDSHTNLVAGSLNISPLAGDDSYTAIGNTELLVGQSAGSSPAKVLAGNLFANDTEFANDLGTMDTFKLLKVGTTNVAGTTVTVTTTQGGTVTVTAASGTFDYVPAAGFTGTDTFTYTVTDDGIDGIYGNADDLTSTATVTITVANKVWYVDNSYTGANGASNGTSLRPFTSITSTNLNGAGGAGDVDGAGDFIYLAKGTGAAYSGGLALEATQHLVGQGVDLIVSGFTLKTGSAANAATLANSTGSTIALSTDNTVSGLIVNNTAGKGISGSAIGTAAFDNLNITTTNGTGLDLSTSGTLTVTGTNTISSSSAGAVSLANIVIGGSGATFKSISASGAASGILLNSTSGGAFTVTGDGTGLANGSGGLISNATTEAVHLTTASGTVTFKSMNFTLNTSASQGVYFDNNSGGTLTVNVIGDTFAGVTASTSQNKALLQFEAGAAAAVTANVQDSFFNGSRTYGIYATAAGTSTLNVTVNQSGFGTDVVQTAPVNNPGSTITNAPVIGLGITNSASAQVDYAVTNNTFWGASGSLGAVYAVSISGVTTTSASRLDGSFNGNKIGKTGVTGSGASGFAGGLGLLPGTNGSFKATVLNNDIRQVNSVGVNMADTTGGGANSIATLKFKGNTVAEPDTTGSPSFQRALAITASNSGGSNDPWIVEIGDTTGTVPANKNTFSGAWQTGNFVRVSNNGNTTALTMPGLTPTTGATAAQVNAFVQSHNTFGAPATGSDVNTTLGTQGINGGAPLPLYFAPSPTESTSTPTGDGATTPGTTPPVVVADDGFLTQAELDTLVKAAIARWEATGLTPAQDALLHNVHFSVSDLGGRTLGQATPGQIILDNDGAGNGWFVDSTPLDDSEFAPGSTVAANRVDALTTVMHELGHQLGLGDTYSSADSGNLMYGFLTLGTRHTPLAHQADGATGMTGTTPDYALSPITIGTLAAGKSVTVVFDATAQNAPIPAGVNNISLQGTVSGSNFSNVLTDDPGVAGASNPTVTALNAQPDLAITSFTDGVPSVTPGNTVSYTIGYSNHGNQDATGVTLTETLPAGATFNSAGSPGWVLAFGSTYTKTIGALGAGGTGSASFSYTVNNPAPAGVTSLSSTATINDDGTNGTDPTADNSATDSDTLNAQYDLVLTKTADVTSSTPGGVIKYTLGYSNIGNQNTSASTITETLPLHTSFNAGQSTSGWSTSDGTHYTFNSGALVGGAAAGSVIFAVTVDNPAGTSTISNSATIADSVVGDGTDANTANNTPATVVTPLAAVIQFSGATYQVNEDGTVIGTAVTLNRSGDTSGASSVTVTLPGTGTATSGTDYNASSIIVNFAATETTKTIVIPITNDTIVEGTETVGLSLSSPTNANLGTQTTATLSIVDNDTATLAFVAGTSNVGEAASSQNVGVQLIITGNGVAGTGTLGKAVTVNVQDLLTGTATGGGTDYTFTSPTTLTFAAGSVGGTQNATFTINNDTIVEGTEAVNLALNTLSDPTGQVTLGTAAHTLSITDNDTATIAFVSGTGTVGEGTASQNVGVQLIITANGVAGTGTLGKAVTVHVQDLLTGTATAGGTDYTLTTPTTLTFAAGAFSSTQNATLTLNNDTVVEGTETVNLALNTLADTTGQVTLGTTVAHTLSITDNDTATLAFVAGTSTIGEGAGTHTVGVQLVITGNGTVGTGTLGKAVTVNVQDLLTGTATAGGTDYTFTTPTTLTFAAGASGSTQNANFTLNNDSIVEGTETVNLALNTLSDPTSQVTLGTAAHTISITDNDTATIGYSAATSTIGEGAGNDSLGYVLTITANGTGTASLGRNVTFNVTAPGGTATGGGTDYTLPSLVTFAAGSLNAATATANLAITNDAAVEGNETVVLGATIGTDGTGGQVTIATGGAASHTTTITDNDTATIGYSTTTSTVGEGGGNDSLGLVLTITANGTGTPTLERGVTFNVTTAAGGTATGGGTDYTLPSVVTFAAGSVNGATQSANLAINNDSIVEGTETANLGLSIGTDSTGGQITIATGAAAAHTTTITDDDIAKIRFNASTSTIGEGAGNDALSTVLVITAGAGSTGTPSLGHDVTFNVTTAAGGTATGGGTDYTLPSLVTFATGSLNNATQTANLAIVNDSIVEGTETANLGLAIATDGTGGQVTIATGANASHTVTITDNDTATIGYAATTSIIGEGAGNDSLGYVLTITANGTGTASLGRDVTFNVTTSGGTATSGTDYTLPSLVTFAAGSLNNATTAANLAITNDASVEGSETILLGASIATDNTGGQVTIATGGAASHTTTITDNDTATIGYATPTSTVGEAAGNDPLGLVLTITANGTGTKTLERSVTFNVTTTGGTATGGGVDYTLPSLVTFAAGSLDGATQTANLAINNDTLIEGSETANLGLTIGTDSTGGQVTIAAGAAASHITTITDDDNGAVTIAKINDGAEGGANGKFRITQSGVSTTDTVVTYQIGGTATGADYGALTGTATILAGQTTVDVDVVVTNDTIVEGTETVTALLTGFTAHDPAVTLGATTNASLNIADNDTATIHFVSGSSSATEGDGTKTIAVQLDITANGVAGTGTLGKDVSVNVSDLLTGTAAPGNSLDYTFAPATVTFASGAGSGSQNVTVTIHDDAIVEASETVNLGLGTLVDGTGGQASISGISAHTLTITDNDSATISIAKISDGAEGTTPTPGKFRVTQSAVSSTDTVVSYTVNGSATPGSDYTALTGTVTILAGQTTADIDVAVLDDVTVEPTETVGVTLSDVTAGHTAITVGATKTASLDIAENDVATVSIAKISDGAESNSPTPGKFRVTQSLVSSVDTVVSYTIGGTATAGSDYTTLSGTVTILAGQTTADIDVAVLNDNISEANETVSVTLDTVTASNPGITIAGAAKTASLNITDNDIDLTVTKTQSASSVIAGSGTGNLVYTITVKNNGQVDATNIHLAEDLTLPSGTTLGSIVASNGSFAATTAPDGTWTIPALAKGASETLTVTLTAGSSTAAGTNVISDTATLSSADQNIVNTGDDSFSLSTSVTHSSDLSITKTTTPLIVKGGKGVSYTIVVSNTGPSDVVGATVSDLFPSDITGVTYTVSSTGGASGFANGAGNISQTVDMPVGSTITYMVNGTVIPVPTSTTISNTATVTDASDTNTANNSSTATSTVYHGIYVVSPGIAQSNKFSQPKILVFDPATGNQIYSFLAYEPTYKDSIRVAVADMNGDGFDDIITTTAKGTGRLRVFDGLTGEQFTTGAFGHEIAVFDGKKDKGAFVAAGDLNGDGHDDIVVGSALGRGKVEVLDGVTGSLITLTSSGSNFFQPFGKNFTGGVRVATGDTNGDGKDELIVGMGYRGAEVKVYSGTSNLNTIDGTVLQDFKVGVKSYRGGVSVSAADLDGDGKADLIVGRNTGKPSQIETFSGLDLHSLGGPILPFDVNPAKPKYSLGVRVAAVDVNFDGVADIIAGAGGRADSQVKIFDGVTHELIRTVTAYPLFPTEALFVAGSSPVPGTGVIPPP